MSAILNQTSFTTSCKLNQKWAQNLVNSLPNPTLRNTTVKQVEVVSINVGTTTRIRLQLDHDADGILPKRWFVKLPSQSFRARAITALPRLLPTEIRFYNELAQHIPLTIPKIIATQRPLLCGSALVMHDVSEIGASPGKAGDALTAEQALLVTERLANLHTSFHAQARHDKNLRWLAGPIRRLEDGLGSALAVPLMQRGLRLAEDIIPQHLHAPALNYACNRRHIMQFLSTPAPTLLHHDCHPGNLFWHNGEPGFLDWQMVRLGEGISDISYFMATALTPETRRECEMSVLKRYYELMKENRNLNMNFSQLVNRYRIHLAYPFEAMALTLAVGGLMQIDSNLEMLKRGVAAINDHETLQKLKNFSNYHKLS